jgi:hypothetical protein
MTNVSCSFDGDNNVIRSFEGRYCTSANRCFVLRVSPAEAGPGALDITRRPDGGFLQRGSIYQIRTSVNTDSPPTARIGLLSDFGDLFITGCPAS